jgi:hypothetical protein
MKQNLQETFKGLAQMMRIFMTQRESTATTVLAMHGLWFVPQP